MPLRLTIALSLLAGLTACSPRLEPLTDSVRKSNRWSEADLEDIQFYLSEDLVLSRERKAGSTKIVQGRVRVENGRDIEEVVVKRGTPGVVLFSPKDGHLAIGFDPSDDSRFLVFGPNPKQRGRYTLLASDWERYSGKVSYAGETWRVSASDADVGLLFDIKRSGTVDRKVQSPGGRRVGG